MKVSSQALLGILILLFLGISTIYAQDIYAEDAIVQGGQFYDRWYAVVDVNPPEGEMPIWNRQQSNSRTGEVTWRCVECHGWDYKGVDGAYGSGSHYTGFPNIISGVRDQTPEDIIQHLSGENDQAHDFSPYLDRTDMEKIAAFILGGIIDDSVYIDSTSLKVIGGDLPHGEQLYKDTCQKCHGEDGKTIVFRTEGVNEYLGSIAHRDPWRFLHRTRFGVANTDMPIGITLGWSPSDGRDVLLYAQTFPTGFETQAIQPSNTESETSQKIGGPGSTIWRGILTGFGMFIGLFGSSILFISLLLIVIGLVVWALRQRS